MRDPPLAVLTSEYGRHAKRDWRQVVGAADLHPGSLDLDDIREVRRRILRDALEANGLALPELSNGALQGLLDLVPTAGGRPKRVGKRDIVAPREQPLLGLGVSSDERIQGSVVLLDDLREIGSRHRILLVRV